MKIPPHPFYIMRHGETEWNKSNLIMGHTDIPLNERGKNQAHKAIKSLKGIQFSKIWSSPLQRARQTASIINKEFSYPLVIHDNLKERGWGTGEGESYQAYPLDVDNNPEVRAAKENLVPSGAETCQEFEGRIILALQEILTPGNFAPLIVSHGGVIRVLSKLLLNIPLVADNCALYHFAPGEDSKGIWQLVNLNKS